MGKPIVVFQAMIDSAAKAFPNALKGYKLDVVESHQTGKADTSGTAKAVVESMGGLGLNGSTEKIQMIREPEQQVAEMGVPKDVLGITPFIRTYSSADVRARSARISITSLKYYEYYSITHEFENSLPSNTTNVSKFLKPHSNTGTE